MTSNAVPSTGWRGLKENWTKDLVSGFILSLIALPLCLGIAAASNFPPTAGLIAAIVGGVLVSRINGSFVTINGPAAGLISVNAAAVLALGHGDPKTGYPLALAAIVVSGAIVFLLGLVKAGKFASMVPSNAVHGMLAAIGVIIISKQIHPALGVKATATEPLELLAEIPHSLLHMDVSVAMVAAVSFLILVVHPLIKLKLIRMIPAPLWVMAVAIPLAQALHLAPRFLIHLDSDPTSAIVLPDFSAIGTGAFWMAVLSITLVTALETVLSATAVDKLDPYRRKSNLSRDMGAMGLGTTVSASIGGLPMIAEIVRSSANISNGARTQWSNFFHGLFLVAFMLFLVPVINLIPVSALAAMLVFTGLRLASPKTFRHAFHLGKDQLLVMLTTLVVTLATDLLIGIGAGIAAQLLLNLLQGSGFRGLFLNRPEVEQQGVDRFIVHVKKAAIFTNFLTLQGELDALPKGGDVTLNLRKSKVVDCTVMEGMHEFRRRYEEEGGKFNIVGLEGHKPLAHHPLAGRILKGEVVSTLNEKLDGRQKELHEVSLNHFAYFKPGRLMSTRSLSGYPTLSSFTLQSESDVIIGKMEQATYEWMDLHCEFGFGAESGGKLMTTIILKPSSGLRALPVFSLEPERFLDDLAIIGEESDIDFGDFASFSRKWLLRGPDQAAVRSFFSPSMIHFLDTQDANGYTMVSDGNSLLFHCEMRQLAPKEGEQMLQFARAFMRAAFPGRQTGPQTAP